MRPCWPPLLSILLGLGLGLVALLRPPLGGSWPPLAWALLGLLGAFAVVVGADAWRHRLAQARLKLPPAAPPASTEGA